MKKLLFLVSCFLMICGFNVLADDTVSYRQPAAGQESDPIVGAINGIVKADGAGNVSQAQAGTDYLAPNGSAANLTDFPTFNQNTTGTAANLSGTPALPDGTTATTQAASDNSTKLATTAYADAKVADAINDGTTTVAPSENAVYDALAGKAPSASPTFTGTVTLPTATYTVALTDYSSTSTISGWSSFTLKQLSYAKIGHWVFVIFDIEGTSNATDGSFTLPYKNNSGITQQIAIARAKDNSVALADGARGSFPSGGSIVYTSPHMSETSWKNSGGKVVAGSFWYYTSS